MTGKSALLVANGVIEDVDWLASLIENFDELVAVDGGACFLHQIGRLPAYYVGDEDSITDEVSDWLNQNKVKRVRYPKDKNETDLELALGIAIESGIADVSIVGAFGDRIDHELANLALLSKRTLADKNIDFLSPGQRVCLGSKKFEISGEIGDLVSLIPLNGDVEVLSTTGLKWPLNHEVLNLGSPRGISNVMTDEKSIIELTSGNLICIHISAHNRAV